MLPTHSGNIRRSSISMSTLYDNMLRCSSIASSDSAHDPDTSSSRSSRARVRQTARRDAELKITFDEMVRVRRWSVCSSEISAETMHSLTSAPSVVVGGQPIFLNPNADVKRIRPLLLSTVPPNDYMQTAFQSRSLHLRPTASPKAARRPSEILVPQRISEISTRSSNVLRSPSSRPSSASFIDGSDSSPSSPEGSPPLHAARALRLQRGQGHSSPQLMHHASDTPLVSATAPAAIRDGSRSVSADLSSRSVTGQSRMRPVVRSARFGNYSHQAVCLPGYLTYDETHLPRTLP